MKTQKSRARILAEEAAQVREKTEEVKEKWTARSDDNGDTTENQESSE